MLKPMLAGQVDIDKLVFPQLASPKLDGVRALVISGVVFSRSLKPIPNRHVQDLFKHLDGYDGELIVGDPTDPACFRNTSSGVMSIEGKPNVIFHVFDYVHKPTATFIERYSLLKAEPSVIKVPHHVVCCHKSLLELETKFLEQGFEGVMLRTQSGPYKYGRSTTKEGWLLKLKRFADSEAVVLSMEEKLHNANESTVGELGQTKRTSHMANMVPTGTMGALVVKDLVSGIEFSIGTGFDDALRSWFWDLGPKACGLIVKYKYFPTGSKDKPRFPTYLGLRDPLDTGD